MDGADKRIEQREREREKKKKKKKKNIIPAHLQHNYQIVSLSHSDEHSLRDYTL
jgi:hypothetical protein